jgi:4-amino-4-deoxy-L-arabinose transferase-like glycosyltransferase
MSKKIVVIILLGIVFLGGFLRFYNITEKGFFVSDESFFAIVSKTLAMTPKVLVDGILHHRDNLGAYIKEQLWWGAQNTTARPGFIFPVAFLMMILGTHDYVPFVFNALLGTILILLVYLVGISIYNSKFTALTASFLLAVSNYHIFYSRSGLSQNTTAFFLILALLLYLSTFQKSEKLFKKLFLSGLCFGYLLSTHQSTVPIIGFIFLFDFIFLGNDLREKIKRLFYLGFGIILVMVFWEIILGARKLIANYFHLSWNVHTYFEELGFVFWNNISGWPANPDKLFYFDLLKRFDGWIPIILLFLGILVFIFKKDWRAEHVNSHVMCNWRDKKTTFIFIFTWFILIFWAFVSLKATRTMAMYMPVLVLFYSYSLSGIFGWLKNKIYKFSLVGFVLGLIFILNLGTTWQILNLRSGYKEVADYLKNNNFNVSEIKATGMGWLHYDFYLNQKFNPYLENPRILISDWGSENSWQEFSKQGKLIAAFQNPIGSFYPAIKDIYYGASTKFAEEVAQTPNIDKIGVFSVK